MIISHNLQDVFAVSDIIYVLYLGTMTAKLRAAETTPSEVVEYITGGKTAMSSAIVEEQ
ncbi:MAG: hypothetical protein ACKOE2_17405 [Actinomycetales bacterium]